MKRTQLYLDETMARKLSALSRQKGTTVSQLVRESLREKYMTANLLDRARIAEELSGIWAERKELKNVKTALRKLRKGKRLKRLGVG